ncbi:heparan sulfate glucosamine 3-O-sulfotransferase 1-like [Diadema antillarum]|uniref:heparan sulfate glucosamine 3-O-sulfotransferase 1-like n=1 Tax=Diadema antillarum TaxID=105358 RepID=UPI003A874A19
MDWYRNRMPVSSKYQLTMEKTPNYFTSSTIQRDIQRMMPDSTKFILVVRDPVVRALSHYVHLKVKIKNPEHFVDRPLKPGQRSLCFINNTFETTVVRPNGALMDYNCILTGGIYHQTFTRWLSVFPRERFFVIDGDQFQADPLPILKELESFLQLPKFFDGSHIYFDESKGFFCRRGYKPKQTCLGDGKGRTHPVIGKRVEQRLREFFRPHNEKLFEQIGRTFDWK